MSLLAFAAAGCGRDSGDDAGGGAAAATNGSGDAGEKLSGQIVADGSSTVAPLTTAAAESFREEQGGVDVTVGTSGTGGGFEKFCSGETDISDASRPIKDDEEAPICKQNGVEYTEFQVATDALTVVVSSENDWADCLTVEQLNAIWKPGSKIENWSQVPGGDYPDEKLTLAGPGTDSGTFDYFTNEVNGEEGASRSDYTASEDDNVIVRAVEGAKGALGYFGFTYYEENENRLKALGIDAGDGCVDPSVEAAQDGTYKPLSRPLFIYVKNEALQRPEVAGFVRYYIENALSIAEDALFVPLTDEQESEQMKKLEETIGA
ncbi:MAG: PstS family phosphate ABC transporter substrate-binding protein [Thermoleophilia bacterium]|nr:PstS family phosphate ABC transporter substrate-binding protein [Thermoleophilia bacterium]